MNILEKLGLNDDEFINQQNIDNLNSPLSKADLLKEPESIKLGSFEQSSSEQNSLSLNFNAQSNASMQVFNSDDDTDDNELLAINNPDGFIPFNSQVPVIKYLLSVKAGLDGSTSIGKLDLGIEANASLEAMAYLTHDGSEKLAEALLIDMKDFPSILSLANVQAMKEGDAIAIETEAKLGASLSFELSDVFTAGLSGLTKVLESDKLISLDISSGVKIGASYALEDSYQLIFVKDTSTAGFNLKVSVKKANSKSTSASASAGVSVGFNDPNLFSSVINGKIDSLVSQVVGIADDVYEQIEGKLNDVTQNLNTEAETAVQKLLEHFGIEDVSGKYEQLKDKLDELKQKIEENITETAKEKLELSIGFEYSKVTTNSTLLTAALNSELFSIDDGNVFKQLLLFNPQPLIEAATDSTLSSKIKVNDSLKAHMSKTSSKWGITIGFGKFKIGGSDTTTKEFSISTNLEGHQKVSFDGVRGYKEVGSLGGFSDQWSVGFNPEMSKFSKEQDPAPQEFDNSYVLMMEHFANKFRGKKGEKQRIAGIVDTAVCWGIIPIEEFENTLNPIWNTLEAGKTKGSVTLNTSLNFTPQAFKSICQSWFQLLNNPAAYDAFLAKVFAMSMPYLEDYDARKKPNTREQTYASLWLSYLNGSLNAQSLSITAQNHLENDHRDLARLEGKMGSGSMSSIIKMNPSTNSRWKSFGEGIKNYLEYYNSNEYPDFRQSIRQCFQDMKSIWAQSFDTRVFGSYINKLAVDNEAAKEMNGVLTVSYQDKSNNKKKLVFKNT